VYFQSPKQIQGNLATYAINKDQVPLNGDNPIYSNVKPQNKGNAVSTKYHNHVPGTSGYAMDARVHNVTYTGETRVHKVTNSEETRTHDETHTGETESDNWVLVNSRRSKYRRNENQVTQDKKTKSVLEQGMKITNKLKVTQQNNKVKALFVTRLEADVTCNEMESYIQENTKIIPIKCVKLKTKFPNYASFYILLKWNEYETVANANFWPQGVLFTQFFGKLREDMFHTNNESEQSLPIDHLLATDGTRVQSSDTVGESKGTRMNEPQPNFAHE
jgi:hypothetical protein